MLAVSWLEQQLIAILVTVFILNYGALWNKTCAYKTSTKQAVPFLVIDLNSLSLLAWKTYRFVCFVGVLAIPVRTSHIIVVDLPLSKSFSSPKLKTLAAIKIFLKRFQPVRVKSLFVVLGARFPNYPIIHFDYFCFIQTLIYILLLLYWLNDTNLVILMRSVVDWKLSPLSSFPNLKTLAAIFRNFLVGHFLLPSLFSMLVTISPN